MSKKASTVPRPRKKAEYEIIFATRQATRGWQDLLATTHNAIVDSWDFLTKTPDLESPRNHRLKGDLATVRNGARDKLASCSTSLSDSRATADLVEGGEG